MTSRENPSPSGDPIRLRDVAHGKSGDKGDSLNVGVIALAPDLYEILVREVTPERVNAQLRRPPDAPTTVYPLPRLGALNVVVHAALEGGGTASLRLDSMAKNVANVLFEMPIELSGPDRGLIAELAA